MKPTIGRIVHYTSLGDRDGKYPVTVQAAIITGVNKETFSDASGAIHHTETVSLHVFYKTGQFDLDHCWETTAPAGSENARGKWCWPAREGS